jgi:hypothetical protein
MTAATSAQSPKFDIPNLPVNVNIAQVYADFMTYLMRNESLEFVTEGEASVHWALAYHGSSAWPEEGTLFAVVDAGGFRLLLTVHSTNVLPSNQSCL